MMVFNIFLVILATFALIYAYIQISEKHDKISKEIGEQPMDVIMRVQDGEKALIFLDFAARMSVYEAIYDLQSSGGISKTSKCGTFYGFNMWNSKAGSTCFVDSGTAKDSLKDLFISDLVARVAMYPSADFVGNVPTVAFARGLALATTPTSSTAATAAVKGDDGYVDGNSVLSAALKYEGRAYGTGQGEFVCVSLVEQVLKDLGVSVSSDMHKQIFIIGGDKSGDALVRENNNLIQGVSLALTSVGMGASVKVEDAKAGDFVQYWWQKDGVWNGHSAIIYRVNGGGKFDVYGAHSRNTGVTTAKDVDLSDKDKKVYIVRLKNSAIPASSAAGSGAGSGSSALSGCSGIKIGIIGASNTEESASSWSGILKSKCSGAQVTIAAKVGYTPSKQKSELLQGVLAQKPDVVIISPSANGIESASSHLSAVKEMAASAKAAGAKVAVLSITPHKYYCYCGSPTCTSPASKENWQASSCAYKWSESIQSNIEAFNSALSSSKLGSKDIDFAIDIYSLLQGSESGVCGYCGADGGHLTKAGGTIVADAVMKTVFGGSTSSSSTAATGASASQSSSQQSSQSSASTSSSTASSASSSSASSSAASSTSASTVTGCGTRVAAVGDSITAGASYVRDLQTLCGSSSNIQNQDQDPATPYTMPPSDKRGQYDKFAFVSKRTDEMRDDFSIVLSWKPDTVILLGGTNDANNYRSWEKIRDDLDAMYKQAQAAGIRVVAVTIPPLRDKEKTTDGQRAIISKVNEWILKQSSADIKVDIYNGLTISGTDYVDPQFFVADLIHPDADGKKVIANAIYKSLTSPSAPQPSSAAVSAAQASTAPITSVSGNVLPSTLYDFLINSSDGMTTIVGIARQNIAVGVNKSVVNVSASATCRPIIADKTYDIDFLKKTYGQNQLSVESQLQTMKFMGVDVQVHRLITTALGCVQNKIKACTEGSSYSFRTIDSYSWQPLSSDPNLMATSSFGISLNINLDTNPNAQDGTLVSDIPKCVVEAFKYYGFKWGGDNSKMKTPAHFEFMADPGVITVLSSEANQELSKLTPSCTRSGQNLADNVAVNTPNFGQITLSPSKPCSTNCERKIVTRSDYVVNNKNAKQYFVMHTTAGGAGTVDYFTKGIPGNPHVGTQYVIGRDGTTTMLTEETAVLWHAPGYNYNGIGVENQNSEDLCRKICTASRSYCSPSDCQARPSYPSSPTKTDQFQKYMFSKVAEQWQQAQVKAAVKLASEVMIRNDIPIDHLVRHADSSADRGTGHNDPGPQLVWETFKSNVQSAINQYNLQAGNCKEAASSQSTKSSASSSSTSSGGGQ
ncbi:N-acetylmuramoyl-L-alanine amidase [Candidatus Woesearchaeota archaeon]|nr:N-acetylmuramoyl-L-alanine amidase [Candidatus Woesearchaeota archaeon]